jgi:hypothetical protein
MLRILLFLALSSSLTRAGGYTQAMFRAALTNYTTSPDYVLITVRGPGDQTERTVCTTANFLLGAIDREHGLGSTELDQKRERDIALQTPECKFTFHKKAAIDNLADYETPEALAYVRRQFVGKTDAELVNRDYINSVVNASRASHNAYRDAVAHALLERGIGCKQGCESDELFPHLKGSVLEK